MTSQRGHDLRDRHSLTGVGHRTIPITPTSSPPAITKRSLQRHRQTGLVQLELCTDARTKVAPQSLTMEAWLDAQPPAIVPQQRQIDGLTLLFALSGGDGRRGGGQMSSDDGEQW
jgi:hypothetical protein